MPTTHPAPGMDLVPCELGNSEPWSKRQRTDGQDGIRPPFDASFATLAHSFGVETPPDEAQQVCVQ